MQSLSLQLSLQKSIVQQHPSTTTLGRLYSGARQNESPTLESRNLWGVTPAGLDCDRVRWHRNKGSINFIVSFESVKIPW